MDTGFRGNEMSRTLEEIEKDIAELSEDERADLIDRLNLDRLKASPELLDEAERRLKKMEAGQAVLIEGSTAFEKARQALSERG